MSQNEEKKATSNRSDKHGGHVPFNPLSDRLRILKSNVDQI